jgi:hypothetical protein
VTGTDWLAWHEAYRDPGSALSLRLSIVRRHVAAWLDAAPTEPRVVSACAGEGRDLLGVLGTHPRGREVHARLVETDPALVARARAAAAAARLDRVEVLQADAGLLDSYDGAVPADLVMMCGVFGNVPESDIRRTLAALPLLCAPRATVVWTRSRHEPDRTPGVRGWFRDSGFEEVAFEAPTGVLVSVGVHRLTAPPRPLRVDDQTRPPEVSSRMFSFRD